MLTIEIVINNKKKNYEDAVILSIKPKYIKLILSGEKEYEFRKVIPRKSSEYFLIHVSKPISTIKYIFKMESPKIKPDILEGNSYGVELFNSSHSDYKFAYKISKIYEILEPISYEILKSKYNYSAPQNFIYLGKFPNLLNLYKDLDLKEIK